MVVAFARDSEWLGECACACRARDHAEARTNPDPTIAVCWDADRLNLWWVGIAPDPGLLSSAPARDNDLIGEARSFHDGDYGREELTRRAIELTCAPS